MSLTFYLLLSLLFLFFFTSLYDTKPHVQTFTDRHDVVIGSLNPDFKGFQIWTHFSDISPEFVAKTIQKEDRFFYWHQGVNPWALLKALGSHLLNTGVRRGGSTITQQLAKNLIQEKLCQENECRPLPRNIPQKIKETVLALGLEMKHSKKWILERYLNTIYYGNHCYGVGAASQYYFSKTPQELTLAEINTLTSLPQSPTRLSKNITPQRNFNILNGRHFIEFVSQEKHLASRVQTTLDLELEKKTEQALQDALKSRIEKDPKLTAAAVVIDVKSGDVLAMVGSRDYLNEEIQGQVNGATALRQPGSTLKPFTYFAAFTQGYSPNSLIQDQPTSFHIPTNSEENDSYMPQNFDRRFHGAVTIREALANSYNVPAVVTLNDIGLSYYHEMLRRFGFSSITQAPTYYGLSITLGSAEVSLLELTNAYAALARGGKYLPYQTQTASIASAAVPVHAQAQKAALLTTSILTDSEARRKAFGYNEDLIVEGHEVAVKTGTSYDHRDNWTVGYTPSYAVGVWVGHADGTPLDLTTGASGAGPVWHKIMEALLEKSFQENFPHLETIKTVFQKPEVDLNKAWKVLSPLPYARYREHGYLPTEHQALKLEAKAWEKDIQLSWYLDGVLLDTTQNNHQIFIQPLLGKHVLTVSDQKQKEVIPFFVSGDL